jgi:hypothetical protein
MVCIVILDVESVESSWGVLVNETFSLLLLIRFVYVLLWTSRAWI